MKILVINGSPKGAYSITLQTVNYLMNIYASVVLLLFVFIIADFFHSLDECV